MPITPVQRTRIIFDLMKNGTVTTEANYDSPGIDYLDGPTALKYADAMIEVYQYKTAAEIAAMSNAERSKRVINLLRGYVRQALVTTRRVPAASTAANDAAVIANSEADAEIGTEE